MTRKRINVGQTASFIRSVAIRHCGWFLVCLVCFVVSSPAAETKTIVFFGDSITAGYGLDPDEAYPAVIQRKLVESGRSWRVVNAGLSGETTTGGLRRLDWILRQPVDIFVIELGGNDGLRGIPPEASRANLQAMMERIRAKYPNVVLVLAGMQLPTNLGPEHTREFAAMYPDLARINHATLIPFLLEGVGGIPALNQADGIHPTAEGHCVVAENVWNAIKKLL
ncbi:MAG: arylesterase [Opitutae bacterium]